MPQPLILRLYMSPKLKKTHFEVNDVQNSQTENSCQEVCMHAYMLSHLSQVQLFETPWTVACQTSLSLRFSRKKYWTGFLCLQTSGNPCPTRSADNLRYFSLCCLDLRPQRAASARGKFGFWVWSIQTPGDLKHLFHLTGKADLSPTE